MYIENSPTIMPFNGEGRLLSQLDLKRSKTFKYLTILASYWIWTKFTYTKVSLLEDLKNCFKL